MAPMVLIKEIEKYARDQREELLEKIGRCCQVNSETAAKLLHNFLGGGLDAWILKTNPGLAIEVGRTVSKVDMKEVGCLLSVCFEKNSQEVEALLKKLFREVLKPEDLTSFEGLTRTWIRQAKGLTDIEQVDFSEALVLLETCNGLLESDWQELLGAAVDQVRNKLLPFMGGSGVITRPGLRTTSKAC